MGTYSLEVPTCCKNFSRDRLIDTELEWYHLSGNPSKPNQYAYEDYSHNGNNHNYFYAEYVGGDAFSTNPPYNSYRDYFLGVESVTYYAPTSIYHGLYTNLYLYGSNFDQTGEDVIEIRLSGYLLSDLQIGLIAEGYNEARTPLGGRLSTISNLILTSISDVNPVAVSEPGTFALLSFGFLAFAAWNKRKNNLRIYKSIPLPCPQLICPIIVQRGPHPKGR